jgi:O-antigen/teichoic acid export membrane protein
MKQRPKRQKSLGGLATRALGWSFFNNAFARIGTLGIGVVLARLLGPQQFGTFAVALVALVALLSFNELGVSLAIVRWEGEPREIAPTVATISVLTSVAIYVACFFAAPAFSSAMGAPSATNVIRVLALNVVVDGFVSTPAALMQRYFRQDKKAIADQVNNWLGAGVSIGLAFSGLGAMSLAIGRMTGAVVSGIIFVVLSPEPLRFGFDRAKARALFRFGMPLAGASLVVFAVGNADELVVGHVLGATALGFYALAFNLASWPVNIFSVPVRSVAPAVFSRLQKDPSAMRASFISTAGLLGSATIPICLLISGAAVPLLEFIYGARWIPAAHALLWLAVLGAFRILFELVYDYFVVLARSRVVFTVQVVWLVALIPALIIGTKIDGIAGTAIAEVAVAALLIVPWYLWELAKVGIPRRALALRLCLPTVAAIGVGAAAAGAARLISNDLVACIVGGLVALAVIGLLVYRMRPAIAMLRQALNRPNAPETATAPQGEPQASALSATGPPERTAPHAVDAAAQQAGIQALFAMSRPVLSAASDLTGPLPVHQDTADVPLYRDIVTRLNDDAKPERGSASRHQGDEDLGAAS